MSSQLGYSLHPGFLRGSGKDCADRTMCSHGDGTGERVSIWQSRRAFSQSLSEEPPGQGIWGAFLSTATRVEGAGAPLCTAHAYAGLNLTLNGMIAAHSEVRLAKVHDRQSPEVRSVVTFQAKAPTCPIGLV